MTHFGSQSPPSRCERLDGGLLGTRYPQFITSPDAKALFLPDNGVLDAALANETNIQLARKHGATILEEVQVTGITKYHGFLQVRLHSSN